MNYLEILLIALALDAAFGEPKLIWSRAPHPAVLMGRAVDLLDRRLNSGAMRQIRGGVAIALLVFGAGALGILLAALPFNDIWQILLAAILIAQRSLSDHVFAVAKALNIDVSSGRASVAMIVGRDTTTLDESGISRAAIESGAENFSDGVVAPVFWFLLFGLPGLLIYKIVNTADSMIGHRNEDYADFGYATAKLDDLLNWVPARIAAGLICIAGRKPGAWAGTREDAIFHRSPNAGWPEAAAAYCLDIALSGPRNYDGVMTHDPFLNGTGRRQLGASDIADAMRLVWYAWGVMVLTIAILAGVFAIA